MSSKKKDVIDFEQSLKQLENIVTAMEAGGLSLEKSLEYFEQGIQLTRICQTALADAEQKVSLLTQSGTQTKLVPFENDENN